MKNFHLHLPEVDLAEEESVQQSIQRMLDLGGFSSERDLINAALNTLMTLLEETARGRTPAVVDEVEDRYFLLRGDWFERAQRTGRSVN